jgi:hypothetical protein
MSMTVPRNSNARNSTKDKGAFPPLVRMAALPKTKRQLRWVCGLEITSFAFMAAELKDAAARRQAISRRNFAEFRNNITI